MKGGQVFYQYEGIRFSVVVKVKTASLARGGADNKPIGSDGHLGSESGMAGWLDAKGSRRRL